MFKYFITLTTLFLLTSFVFSQRIAPIIWEEAIQDLGIVSEGASYTVVFTFANIGTRPVIVDNVRTNCR